MLEQLILPRRLGWPLPELNFNSTWIADLSVDSLEQLILPPMLGWPVPELNSNSGLRPLPGFLNSE
jgi:hypothetical protein